MKTHPVVSPSVAPTRNVAEASGIKNPLISSGSSRRFRAPSINAGKAASDERAEIATACAGAAALGKSRSDAPPIQTAAGYSTTNENTIAASDTRTTYVANAPTADN